MRDWIEVTRRAAARESTGVGAGSRTMISLIVHASTCDCTASVGFRDLRAHSFHLCIPYGSLSVCHRFLIAGQLTNHGPRSTKLKPAPLGTGTCQLHAAVADKKDIAQRILPSYAHSRLSQLPRNEINQPQIRSLRLFLQQQEAFISPDYPHKHSEHSAYSRKPEGHLPSFQLFFKGACGCRLSSARGCYRYFFFAVTGFSCSCCRDCRLCSEFHAWA